MELRRAGEALLRSQPTTLLSALLAPSSARPCQQRLSILANRQFSSSSKNAFSLSAIKRQDEQPSSPSPTTTTTNAAPSTEDKTTTAPQQPASRGAPRTSGVSDEISSILDQNLDFTRRSGTRTSRFSSPSAQAWNRNTTRLGYNEAPSAGSRSADASRDSSLDDVLGMYRRQQQQQQQQPPQQAGSSGRLSERIGDMVGLGDLDLGRPHAPGVSALTAPPHPDTLPRLGSSVGRSVDLKAINSDLARGLRQLDIVVNRNRVRRDQTSQMYHERPGMKRKRLASARWRKRFMDGFKATVQRVQYYKRQGW